MDKMDKKTKWRTDAIFYEIGVDGVDFNPEKAVEAWKNAAILGDEWALQRLKQLEKRPEFAPFFSLHTYLLQKTVIILDDDVMVAQELAAMVQKFGFRTISAANGLGVELFFEKEVIHGMILDLKMPDKDGFAVLDELQARGEPCKVIVYTGYGSKENQTRLQSFPIDRIVLKPCSSKELIQIISDVFGKGFE